MTHKIKKKTVKELNEDLILMEAKLEKFENIVDCLTKKLEVLEKHNKDIPNVRKVGPERGKGDTSEYACKLCECMFKRNNELKVHMREKHKREIKCNVCSELFNFIFELEHHLKKHQEVKTYKCEICDKTFCMKWRLKKHQEAHDKTDLKFCHYFNNKKVCPYDDIGCMFKHAKSKKCKFEQSCKNMLCQFQHSSEELEKFTIINEKDASANESEDTTDNNVAQNFINDDEENDSDSEPEECDTCDRIFKNNDDLNEHQSNDNCGFGCTECGDYFRFENDLKVHNYKNCI